MRLERNRTETEPGPVASKKPDWIISDNSDFVSGDWFWVASGSKRNADIRHRRRAESRRKLP